jgi:hypothetical protein
MAYRSGFCNLGLHESTAPKDRNGKALKVCVFYETCTCECHQIVNEIFELSGTPREGKQNPDYVPYVPTHNLGLKTIEAPGILDEVEVPKNTMISIAPGIIPGAIVKEFTPTPSGRLARGQLTLWVKEICDEWIVEMYDVTCTPQWIAEKIKEYHKLGEFDPGGIYGIFYKWRDWEFAYIDEKPLRFDGYTDHGIKAGLDGCEAEYKRKMKARR